MKRKVFSLFGGLESIFLSVTLLFVCTQVLAQQVVNATSTISAELLKYDLSILRETFQKEHGGLYRYKSKKELQRLFDSCFSALNHPMQQLDFAKSVMFLISSVQDGHTGSNIPRLLLNYYSESEKLFPVRLFFINKKAYVLCSRMKDLPAGSEILFIDQEPVSEIREKLLCYLPSDGKIETKKVQVMNNGAFPFLYAWIFGSKDSFMVRYVNKQKKIETITLKAAPVNELDCDSGNKSGNRRDLELSFLNNNTALLTIKTFDDNRLAGKQNFRDFLHMSFAGLNAKKIDNLVIDLRGNAGGRDEYGALLFSYLTSKPFRYFRSIESTERQIKVNENSLLALQQPQKGSFNGKLFFLIDGLCFSTTADFCAIAKSNKRGVFIGEETGGAYYGNTSGETKKITLPNSKIEITIPKYKYVNDVKEARYKDRGILPDHTILPTITEIIEHKDVQLELALRFANSGKKPQ